MAEPLDRLAVVADIGGTNTRVALSRGTEVIADSIRRYRNADNGGLTDVLTHYLADMDAAPAAACSAFTTAGGAAARVGAAGADGGPDMLKTQHLVGR